MLKNDELRKDKLKKEFIKLANTKNNLTLKDLKKFSKVEDVKFLQESFNLQIDGKLKSFLKQYNTFFYTKDCIKYFPPINTRNKLFCLIGADEEKDEENFQKGIKLLNDEDRNNQDFLNYVLEKNNKRLINILAHQFISKSKELNLNENLKKVPNSLKFKYNPSLYFPSKKGIDLSKIRMTEESIYSTNWYIHTHQIHSFISSYVDKKLNDLVITDATSNVGGNTISFGLDFKNVNAIEIDKLTCDLLKNNVNLYGMKNVNIFCDDYIKIKDNLKQDIVFFDPPWGGTNYNQLKNIKLYISGFDIIFLAKNVLTYNSPYVFIKVPINFDFDSLNKELSNFNPKTQEIKTKNKTKYIIIGLYNNLFYDIEIVSNSPKKLNVIKSPRLKKVSNSKKELTLKPDLEIKYKPSYDYLIKVSDKLKRQTEKLNKKVFTPVECEQFKKFPNINPKTGKGIYRKTYEKITKDCNISKNIKTKIIYEKLVEGRGGYTILELRKIAKENNIDLTRLTKKSDIVNKIKLSNKI